MTIEIVHGYTTNMGGGETVETSTFIAKKLWDLLDETTRKSIVNACTMIERPAYADSWAFVINGGENNELYRQSE